jgi:hypothetical protein
MSINQSANLGVAEHLDVSPAGGRSESPTRPGDSAAATGTQTDRRRGGPTGGREEEPERPAEDTPAKPRRIGVTVGASAAVELEQLAEASGMVRNHFFAAALLKGARWLGNGLSG